MKTNPNRLRERERNEKLQKENPNRMYRWNVENLQIAIFKGD